MNQFGEIPCVPLEAEMQGFTAWLVVLQLLMSNTVTVYGHCETCGRTPHASSIRKNPPSTCTRADSKLFFWLEARDPANRVRDCIKGRKATSAVLLRTINKSPPNSCRILGQAFRNEVYSPNTTEVFLLVPEPDHGLLVAHDHYNSLPETVRSAWRDFFTREVWPPKGKTSAIVLSATSCHARPNSIKVLSDKRRDARRRVSTSRTCRHFCNGSTCDRGARQLKRVA